MQPVHVGIDDPRDWIRREIVEALTDGLRVALVEGGTLCQAGTAGPLD
jgi:hypothetical protein